METYICAVCGLGIHPINDGGPGVPYVHTVGYAAMRDHCIPLRIPDHSAVPQ